jgi:membrane protease YdiL (CAAX protease family)
VAGGRWLVRGRAPDGPASGAATNFGLSLVSPVFLPAIATADDKASLVVSGIATGLVVGVFEELGWTGFAVPQLRLRYGVVSTGVTVGIVWGAWHFLPNLESETFAATLPLALLLVRLFSWLVAFRLLMVWLYERTGSLLLVIIMHASLVAGSSVIFAPIAVSAPGDFLAGILVWATVRVGRRWCGAAYMPRMVDINRPRIPGRI